MKLRLTQPQVELEAWAELGKNETKTTDEYWCARGNEEIYQ